MYLKTALFLAIPISQEKSLVLLPLPLLFRDHDYGAKVRQEQPPLA